MCIYVNICVYIYIYICVSTWPACLKESSYLSMHMYVSIYTYAHSCIDLASSLSTQQMCRPSQTPYLMMSSPQISPQTGHSYFQKS